MKYLAALVSLVIAGGAWQGRAELPASGTSRKGAARGTFDVKVTPQPPDDAAGGPFGRLFLDKTFHGDLEATSRGQMLGAYTPIEGSAAYVAFELVTGTLNGRRGRFILQHAGTMRKNVSRMNVAVVPNSGTDQLTGIAGAMTIVFEGSKHSYEFAYTLTDGESERD